MADSNPFGVIGLPAGATYANWWNSFIFGTQHGPVVFGCALGHRAQGPGPSAARAAHAAGQGTKPAPTSLFPACVVTAPKIATYNPQSRTEILMAAYIYSLMNFRGSTGQAAGLARQLYVASDSTITYSGEGTGTKIYMSDRPDFQNLPIYTTNPTAAQYGFTEMAALPQPPFHLLSLAKQALEQKPRPPWAQATHPTIELVRDKLGKTITFVLVRRIVDVDIQGLAVDAAQVLRYL